MIINPIIIYHIDFFCFETVCLFFCDNNIFLQTTSATLAIIYYILHNCSDDQRHPCRDSVCHYPCLTLQRCSSPSSYLLVMLVVSFLIIMIIINQLVPGGCDHPQQRVQSRAGDRGVQSHNKVPPPSTHIITNIEYWCGSCR